jgi:signal transduction histidine kinase
MSGRHPAFARRYCQALRAHLGQPGPAELATAGGLGRQGLAAGVRTLELARIHEQALADRIRPATPLAGHRALIRRAGRFFAAAMATSVRMSPGERTAIAQLNRAIKGLSLRSLELVASNQELGQEVAHRRQVEGALRRSERRATRLLQRSDLMQEQLRQLSRQVISVQEDERKRISRELHDVIAQSLTGINLRLASLRQAAELDTRGLVRTIASTQRLVVRSVDAIHRFARELRPTVLDDLGLIPALQTFLKELNARTGLHTRLTASAGIEQLDIARRTVLFRVAQEALTNVVRHAGANRVAVALTLAGGGCRMVIQDNGKSFPVQRTLLAREGRCLGLLGMRERLEMVGGSFAVASQSGQGTTITARIPLATAAEPARNRKKRP